MKSIQNWVQKKQKAVMDGSSGNLTKYIVFCNYSTVNNFLLQTKILEKFVGISERDKNFVLNISHIWTLK